MRMRTALASVVLVTAGLCRPGAAADTAGSVALATDPQLSLVAVITAALERAPKQSVVEALRQQSDAWRQRAGSTLAEAPSVAVRHQNDTIGSNGGLREWEGTLDLPLWLPAQRSANRSVAESSAALAERTGAALRLETAGAVREVLWELALAEHRLALARKERQTAARLARDMERRVSLGDRPRSELLLARGTVLAKDAEVTAAVAELAQSQRRYRSLTGLDRVPADYSETPTAATDIGPEHPLLAAALANADRARAGLRLTTAERRANPTLAVGVRREKAAAMEDAVDSVGVSITIPFSSTRHSAPREAEAATTLAEASAELESRRRELELVLQEAGAAIQVTRSQLAQARERSRLAQSVLKMHQSAFEAGEIDLIDLLRVQTDAFAAEREQRRLEIELKHAAARYNQALGVEP